MTNLSNIAARNPDYVGPRGHRSGSVGATAKGLDEFTDIPADSDWVIINPEGDIRLRDDGTDPTGSVGLLIQAYTMFMYNGDLDAVSIVSAAGDPVAVQLSYYSGMVHE